MKFIHVSDTHLGCKVPIEFEDIREEDFLKSFKQVVDFAINEKVDFVIHSGDFFDERFRISLDLLYKVSEELVRLKEEDIPFIAIKGNHDLKGTRGKAFDELKISGLIKEASEKPIEIGDALIYGISEPRNIAGSELRKVYIFLFKKIRAKENYYNIFISHTVPDLFDFRIEDPRIIPFEYYPKDFDFYGFGHIHFAKVIQVENSILSLPGSTERYEISEREVKSKKGFIYYKNGKIDFIELKTRKINIINTLISSEEEIEKLIEKVIYFGKDTIFKLNILTDESLKKEIEEKILDLKSSGYKILYDILSKEKSFEYKEYGIEAQTFEDLLKKIIEEEASKFENKDEILKEFNKLVSIYEDFGSNRVRNYVLDKIRKPVYYQKTLLEW